MNRKDRCVLLRELKLSILLSLQSCLNLDLININDCDAINAVIFQTNGHNRDIGNGSKHTKETTMTPRESGETAHACPPKPQVTSQPKILQDPVLREVFDGLGRLARSYRIEIDPTAKPVVHPHPPHRVRCALREDVKDELTRMVGDGITAPVTEPTRWVSSMIAVTCT